MRPADQDPQNSFFIHAMNLCLPKYHDKLVGKKIYSQLYTQKWCLPWAMENAIHADAHLSAFVNFPYGLDSCLTSVIRVENAIFK